MRWDAARARSRETPRKYVQCGPVGSKLDACAPEMKARCQSYRGRVTSIHLDGEVSACEDCGYHACACHRLLEWSDGSTRVCQCKANTPDCGAFVIEDHCHAHEACEQRRKMPPCATCGHKHVDGQLCPDCTCGYNTAQQLKFVGGGEMLPLPPAEKRVSVCLGCGLKRGEHRSDCHVLHTAIATKPPQPLKVGGIKIVVDPNVPPGAWYIK